MPDLFGGRYCIRMPTQGRGHGTRPHVRLRRVDFDAGRHSRPYVGTRPMVANLPPQYQKAEEEYEQQVSVQQQAGGGGGGGGQQQQELADIFEQELDKLASRYETANRHRDTCLAAGSNHCIGGTQCVGWG